MIDRTRRDIKIFHIVHIDKLKSIVSQKMLFSDAEVNLRNLSGTTIGMNKIKERRLTMPLTSHPDLNVGECVPFYFCPRCPMLYMFYKNNHVDIQYHGGQEPIVHLVIDMKKAIDWAKANNHRWAFTDSNAGSFYFNDFCDLNDLDQLDWNVINTSQWSGNQDKKMAEFLIEKSLYWGLVEEIAVYSNIYYYRVDQLLSKEEHCPPITVKRHWYY